MNSKKQLFDNKYDNKIDKQHSQPKLCKSISHIMLHKF